MHKVRVFLKYNTKCISLISLLRGCEASKPPMLCLPRELWPWHQCNSRKVASAGPSTITILPFAERTGQHLFMWYLLPYMWVHTKKIHIQLQLLRGSCSIKNNKSSRCWELTRPFCHIFAFTKASRDRGLEKGFSLWAWLCFPQEPFCIFPVCKIWNITGTN